MAASLLEATTGVTTAAGAASNASVSTACPACGATMRPTEGTGITNSPTGGASFVVSFAQAKGLRGRTIFFQYGLRNAILPQVTGLAIALAGIMSGAILVEVVFAYPGIGFLLFRAISGNDYFVIQGVVLFIILSVGLSLLILDLLYPFLDPRIQTRKG